MTTEEVKRKLAAIFSADVKDYSHLMRDDETATVRTLNAYREVMTKLIRQHHGRVVDSPGDNLLAEFASVVDGVQAAVAIQKELKVLNDKLAASRKMEFRIGINLGDIIEEGDRIYGDGVNIAARLEALADPGGICISRTAYDQIEDKLPLGYEYLGEKIVKNIPKPIRAYRVLVEPEEFTKKPWAKEVAEGPQEDRKLEETFIGKPESRRNGSKGVFNNHMYIYLGVIVFLFLINLFTYDGDIWFHFPALAWGLILFIHWRLLNSGISLIKSTEERSSISARKRLIAAILAFFFGVFGAHRFYAGKTGTGLTQVFTIGGLGIWCFIDFLIILFGEFTDIDGKKIREWI
ncbi:MAG: NINE protein [Desulfobacteraceae bacterium]|nr:MAG: NINE protein [Desulfobacteraceae bacterium]